MDLGNNNHEIATNLTKRETSRHAPPGGVHNTTGEVVLRGREVARGRGKKRNLQGIKPQDRTTSLQEIQKVR